MSMHNSLGRQFDLIGGTVSEMENMHLAFDNQNFRLILMMLWQSLFSTFAEMSSLIIETATEPSEVA